MALPDESSVYHWRRFRDMAHDMVATGCGRLVKFDRASRDVDNVSCVECAAVAAMLGNQAAVLAFNRRKEG